MRLIGIYKIQSRIKPHRCYIGSSLNIKGRWSSHLSRLRKNIHVNKKLQNHFNKYGEIDLVFSVLTSGNKESIIEFEQFFIDSYKPWFNILPLAFTRFGHHCSEETKRKISQSKKGRPLSAEHRHKISMLQTGKKRGKRSPELNQRMSLINIGRKVSEETKRKMSEAQKGEKNPNWGKHWKWDEETKRKIGASQLGKKHPTYRSKKVA